jgi:hypothetical protein
VSDYSGYVGLVAPPGTRFFVGPAPGDDYRSSKDSGAAGLASFATDFEELLGAPEGSAPGTARPLAVTLPADRDEPTAEDLAGEGAQLLKRVPGNSSGSTMWVGCSYQECWLRRADGGLDHVVVFLLDWNRPGEPKRRLFLPVRPRPKTSPAPDCFTPSGCRFSGSNPPRFMRFFGRSPNQMYVQWRLHAVKPPDEFAKEVAEKGLWEPDR